MLPGQLYKKLMIICAEPGQRAKICDVPDSSGIVVNYAKLNL